MIETIEERREKYQRARAYLRSLTLPDGRAWGEAALDWQKEDADAILTPGTDGPSLIALFRARDMSKSTDTAAVVLSMILARLFPLASEVQVYAAGEDQVRHWTSAFQGFAVRTGLAHMFEFGVKMITHRDTGVQVRVESTDTASAFGARPALQIVDEISEWRTERFAGLWTAVISAYPKAENRDGKLIVMGVGVQPGTVADDIVARITPPLWYVSRHPGPSPWWTEQDRETLTANMLPSAYARVILLERTAGEDAVGSLADIRAAVCPPERVRLHVPGLTYRATLDLAWRQDYCAMAVGHREERANGPATIVDVIRFWKPEHGTIDLAAVARDVHQLCRDWHVASLTADQTQAVLMLQLLEALSIHTEPVNFTSYATKTALALTRAVRDRRIEIPDDAELISQMTTTRVLTTGNGFKLFNPAGSHDDGPVVCGMLAYRTEQDIAPGGYITMPHERAAQLGLSRNADFARRSTSVRSDEREGRHVPRSRGRIWRPN